MKKLGIIISFFLIGVVNIFGQTKIANVYFNDVEKINGEEVILNGVGIRKKYSIKLYACGLYLEDEAKKLNNGIEIADADENMILTIKLLSNKVTSEKFQELIRNGLEKATDGNSYKFEDETRKFLEFLNVTFNKYDVYKIIHSRLSGLTIYKNKYKLGTIGDLEFKKALFRIWLGDNPVNDDLKMNLLGNQGNNPVLGKWKSYYENSGVAKSIVEIYTIKGKVYGRVERMLRESERDAICYECKGNDKNREIEGLEIIKGLKKIGDRYTDGFFTKIENGKVSSCQLWVDKNNPTILNIKYKGSNGILKWKKIT